MDVTNDLWMKEAVYILVRCLKAGERESTSARYLQDPMGRSILCCLVNIWLQ